MDSSPVLDPAVDATRIWFRMDHLLVVVVRAGNAPLPSALLDAVRDGEVSHILGISFGEGTTTNQQRKAIAEALTNKRAATLTESTLVRGILAAIGWLGKKVKPFPHGGLDQALAYLDCGVERARVEQGIREAMGVAGWADLSARFFEST